MQAYDFTKEDAYIQSLLDQNNAKFETLENILLEEKHIHKKLQRDFQKYQEDILPFETHTLISSDAERLTRYANELDVYNSKSVKSFIELLE